MPSNTLFAFKDVSYVLMNAVFHSLVACPPFTPCLYPGALCSSAADVHHWSHPQRCSSLAPHTAEAAAAVPIIACAKVLIPVSGTPRFMLCLRLLWLLLKLLTPRPTGILTILPMGWESLGTLRSLNESKLNWLSGKKSIVKILLYNFFLLHVIKNLF